MMLAVEDTDADPSQERHWLLCRPCSQIQDRGAAAALASASYAAVITGVSAAAVPAFASPAAVLTDNVCITAGPASKLCVHLPPISTSSVDLPGRLSFASRCFSRCSLHEHSALVCRRKGERRLRVEDSGFSLGISRSAQSIGNFRKVIVPRKVLKSNITSNINYNPPNFHLEDHKSWERLFI
jgi:hypothetical protein